MDLIRHLTLFEAVAAEGHFGRAAQSLGMAQPPLSQAIRRLEKELDCTLFDRTSTGAVLTPAGARVLEATGPVHRSLGQVRAAAVALPSTVQVLVDAAVPAPWCAALARRAADVGLVLDLEPASSDEALRRARTSDLPAIVLSPFRTEGLRTSAAVPAPLWEVRSEQGAGIGTVLVHAAAPHAALARLERELHAEGWIGPLRALPATTAVALLATGRAPALLTTHEHLAQPAARPTPRLALGLQVVIRRAARDRHAVQAYSALAEALTELGDA